tara:strand:+ start:50 stop:673 length:624 start_codon:yes stop_codon:yes gene_type:complete
MKLLLLRHEERNLEEPFFHTSLTKKGFENANTNILLHLSKFKINKIYCSPFLRCIQTIYPYCSIHKKKINIENSLYECLNNTKFISTYLHNCDSIEDENILKIKNKKYNSFLHIDYFRYYLCKNNIITQLEIKEEFKKRIISFIDLLIKKKTKTNENTNTNTNNTVLIISHEAVLREIQIYIEYNILKNNRFYYNFIKMGEIIEIDL